jgi:hypothetical protein
MLTTSKTSKVSITTVPSSEIKGTSVEDREYQNNLFPQSSIKLEVPMRKNQTDYQPELLRIEKSEETYREMAFSQL